jgi:recombination protein RecT
VEIMNMNQIRKAWLQGYAKGNSPAHRNFPGEMSKKTVIGRACKLFITSSDDSNLALAERISGKKEENEVEDIDAEEMQVEAEIKENANKEVIDMDPEPEQKEQPEPEKNTQQFKADF